MSKWWFKVPIILFCILVVAMVAVFSKVAYAASGMPEFGQILSEGTKALTIYLDWLFEILKFIW